MDSKFNLTGKNIIVTGAAQGIGLAIANAIVEAGGKVIAVDMNADALVRLHEALGAANCCTIVGNVAEVATASRAVDDGVAAFGKVDCLVNNAGIIRPAMLEKMTAEDWKLVLDVHLTGSFYFLQAVSRHLLARAKAGELLSASIVNISSDAGRRGTIGQINYATAKAGVFGMTMSAARELGKWNIRCNSVGFGLVETSMTETIRGEKFKDFYLAQIPLARWADAKEAARPVCFLLSDAASYITGQNFSANGGMTIGV